MRLQEATTLRLLLAEVPRRVRAAVDTDVFASLNASERTVLDRISNVTGAHVVAYTTHVRGNGIALCEVARSARLDERQLATLQDAERELGRGIVLVAYARSGRLAVGSRRTGEAQPARADCARYQPRRRTEQL